MKLHEITCVNPLNKLKSNAVLPYRYDMNVYRGCSNGCKYCFARYSHYYLEDGNFFDSVYVKKNAAEALDKALSAMRKKPDIINLGGVTDNWQEAERNEKIMPDVLKVLIKHRVPVILSTKTDLVLRDMELLSELNRVAAVNVAVTVTTMGEVWKKLEPCAVPPVCRFAVLAEAKARGMVAGLHMMPVVPYLTDGEEQLRAVFRGAKECGADYAVADALNLRGETKRQFFAFLSGEFPKLVEPYRRLYASGSLDSAYKRGIAEKVSKFFQEFHIEKNYKKPIAERIMQGRRSGEIQMSLFDFETEEEGEPNGKRIED